MSDSFQDATVQIVSTTAEPTRPFSWYLERFATKYQAKAGSAPSHYQRMMLSMCEGFPEEFSSKPISTITFDEVLSLLDATLRYKHHKTRMYVTILRSCYESAFQDGEVSINYMNYIHLRDLLASKTSLTDEHYDSIKDAIYTVPGGKAYGLAAYLNTSFQSVGEIRYEHCSCQTKTVKFIKHGQEQIVTLVDPDAIELLQSIFDDYHERMSDETIAQRNCDHLLFTTKVGTPYTHNQFFWIAKMVRERSGILDLDIDSFQKYLQTRII